MLAKLIIAELKFLAFRPIGKEISENSDAFLLFGLFFTWLAGIGRYWDHPSAYFWQSWGLGSIYYVVVLSLLIWSALYPLRPSNWSYKTVFIFVCLTSPPAILYSIPVERILDFSTAATANMLFLAFVAIWRVALYVHFLVKTAKLSLVATIVGTLLPLTGLVTLLSALNLEQAVFEIMGGIRDATTNDAAYLVVLLLSWSSILLLPFVLVGYGVLVYKANSRSHLT